MHAPFVLIPQYFGGLVFCRSDARYIPFDRESTELLRRLTVQRIDQVLAAKTMPRERHMAIHGFYYFFEARGWFTPDGRFAAKVLDVEPPTDHMVGPLAVHLEVTAQCNLHCSHCFAGDASSGSRISNPLTFDEIYRLFAELAEIGSFRIGLTGGEPFMRDELLEIVDSAITHGLHPCLTTNGLLITDSIAQELSQRHPLRLNISFEGAAAEVNDAVRGPGTFRRVLDRLEHLRRYHVPFGLSFTLTKSNVDQVQHCAILARQSGAEAAVFRPLYPVGKAVNSLEEMPSFEQYTNALKQLSDSTDETGQLHSIDPFSPDIRENTQARIYGGSGCGAGNLVASISVDGHVTPCSFLGSDLVSANIRKQTFSQIWHSGEAFLKLRTATAECGFSGGCRARSLAFNGSIEATDPWHDEYLKHHDPTFLPQSICEVTQ